MPNFELWNTYVRGLPVVKHNTTAQGWVGRKDFLRDTLHLRIMQPKLMKGHSAVNPSKCSGLSSTAAWELYSCPPQQQGGKKKQAEIKTLIHCTTPEFVLRKLPLTLLNATFLSKIKNILLELFASLIVIGNSVCFPRLLCIQNNISQVLFPGISLKRHIWVKPYLCIHPFYHWAVVYHLSSV